MKITILLPALALCVVASAIPATHTAFEPVARDMPAGTIDCNYCTGMLNFCFQCRTDTLKVKRAASRPAVSMSVTARQSARSATANSISALKSRAISTSFTHQQQ
ncbi:hypothetical protein OPT61_g8300 [Boeremia exigua]|uniref:Uncharacterized protein n=1 Tax=Boeremia exigua TaxID=749465 RepID=A0ACC2HZ62_9PLEO|nr:hypothetical protein OPT61_g8300 [Boeremia exigua]